MASSEDEPEINSVQQKEQKRKRSNDIASDEELEIDINLPEPPSKKARRKERQGKSKKTEPSNAVADSTQSQPATEVKNSTKSQQRGACGVWIGNLPFSATTEKLREFLQEKGDINAKDIVRVNLPQAQKDKSRAQEGGRTLAAKTAQNRGFAYVDFSTKEAQGKALALSEKLLLGRRVLIKDAKSFVGRPESKEGGAGNGSKSSSKVPSKKVFVGNLGFDTTKEDLTDVLGKAGRVEDCFLATFEDTGKCKGFGWVRFDTIEAAEAAVRGYFHEISEKPALEAEESSQKAKSSKRVYINNLQGRALRCEFAEDAQTRYKKRFGKEPSTQKNSSDRSREATGAENGVEADGEDNTGGAPMSNGSSREHGRNFSKRDKSLNKDQRRDERRKRHDARTIAPGQALAKAPRATAAIVEGSGKKTSFED